MFSTTRYAAVLLMFSLAAPVMAAEQAAKVDTACAKPNFPTRWMSSSARSGAAGARSPTRCSASSR